MSTLEIKKKAITLRDIPAKNFIDTYAQYLKKSGKVKIPKWIDFVKNGVTNELPPTNPDWYYIRLASIARHIYLRPSGVGALRRRYGGILDRGSRPNHKGLASETVQREAVQALEAMGIVAKGVTGKRVITKAGQKDLDKIAGSIGL